MAADKQIKLSISLLVSNRKDTIRKCMESLKPLLVAVPSELIAVDTVGEENSDGSLAIVREYTDKIIHFDWCNDFSAARNAGLSVAKGEWFLFLDDDEWFEDVDEIVEFFLSGEYKNYNSAMYKIHNYKDIEGKEYSEATLGRMVRKTEKVRFIGRIHEHFSEFSLPCKEFTSYVHHYGYVYQTEEERQAHHQRNQKILREELNAEPHNLHLRTQMALELATSDNEAALAFCEETFRVCREEYMRPEFQWQMCLVFRLYEALGYDVERAEKKYLELKKEYKFSEMLELAVAYQMTRLCLLEGKNYEAYPYEERYFALLQFLETHPKEAQMQTMADFARYRAENTVREMREFFEFSKEHRKKEKNIVLTVSLLVSNRKDTIRKCMESLKPLLAAVPSELIAVDTVGEENSDGSIAIVKEYADKIIHFDWCNDFSLARNTGLSAAKGEWFLFLDDDEWFENVDEIVEFFRSGEYHRFDRAWYIVRNYKDFQGTHYIDTVVERMFRITPQVCFQGRIHEGIMPPGTTVKKFTSYVHHYGYVFKNEEERKKHFRRNVELLESEVQAHPEDARMMAQLMQEYMADKRYRDAYVKSSEWVKKYPEKADYLFAQYLILTQLQAAVECFTPEEAEKIAEELEHRYVFCEVPRAAFVVEQARLYCKSKKYKKAYEKVKEYFQLAEVVLKNENDFLVQEVFELRMTFSEQRMNEIRECLISVGLKCGEKDAVKPYLERIVWNDENNKPFGVMVSLAEAYGETGDGELFFHYAEQILKNPQMKNPFFVTLEGILREHPERKAEISAWMLQKSAEEKQQKADTELQKLVAQLKANIQLLLAAGKTEEAKELLEALKELVPEK